MQAIEVKFLGPTNARGARLKASASAGSIIIPFPYDDEPEMQAAEALRVKIGWDDEKYYGKLIGGTIPNGNYVFVMTGRKL